MTVNELYALSAVKGIEVHSVKCPKSKAIALNLDDRKFIGIDRSVLKSEYLNDGTVVIYAKTPLINDCVDVSYGKVNLQIATKGNRSVVGWPLILGSY